MNELTLQDSGRVTVCRARPTQRANVVNNLLAALQAAVDHPDARVQALARSTLRQVRSIQVATQRRVSSLHLELLIEQIAVQLHTDGTTLKSKSRTQRIAFMRQIAVFVTRRVAKASFESVAATLNRHHSTIIHSYQVIERRRSRDLGFRVYVDNLEAKIAQTGA
jgi:chromosomal replication initiation ATPase DnaA